ncbi:MAG: acyl-CoA thioesterase [Ruminococcus callidus]
MEITPYTRMVFYHETDRMDIVNHSNYIHMAEEARVDFMEKIGIGYSRMEEQGIMLPVLGVTCEYKHSLHFGEHLAVYSYITKYNGFKLELRYDIVCIETGQLCASCHFFPLLHRHEDQADADSGQISGNACLFPESHGSDLSGTLKKLLQMQKPSAYFL